MSLYLYVDGKGLEPWAQTMAKNMTCILSCAMHMTRLSHMHCIEKIINDIFLLVVKA